MAQTEGTRPSQQEPLFSPEAQEQFFLQAHVGGLVVRHADDVLAPQLFSFQHLLIEQNWSMSGVRYSNQIGENGIVPVLRRFLGEAGAYYHPKEGEATPYTQLQRDLERFPQKLKADAARANMEVFRVDTSMQDIQACSALLLRLMKEDFVTDPSLAENQELKEVSAEVKSHLALAEKVGRHIGRLFVQDEITSSNLLVAKLATRETKYIEEILRLRSQLEVVKSQLSKVQGATVSTDQIGQSDYVEPVWDNEDPERIEGEFRLLRPGDLRKSIVLGNNARVTLMDPTEETFGKIIVEGSNCIIVTAFSDEKLLSEHAKTVAAASAAITKRCEGTKVVQLPIPVYQLNVLATLHGMDKPPRDFVSVVSDTGFYKSTSLGGFNNLPRRKLSAPYSILSVYHPTEDKGEKTFQKLFVMNVGSSQNGTSDQYLIYTFYDYKAIDQWEWERMRSTIKPVAVWDGKGPGVEIDGKAVVWAWQSKFLPDNW